MKLEPFFAALIIPLYLCPIFPVSADTEKWFSLTIDNDAFIGDDSGYSHGLFGSTFTIKDSVGTPLANEVWVKPLMWSMPKQNILREVNSYSVGQAFNTPSNIKVENPSDDELPYSALLAISNSYIAISDNFADIATTKIGVVGPIALGKETQTFIHKLIGANKPRGWDTQIKNELVFEFSRGRSYRAWFANNDKFDIIANGQFSLGTIRSSIDASTYIRLGNNLAQSFPTTLLVGSRLANPIAVNGWYIFAGIKVGYMFNNIAGDGNTFRKSRSIDYQREYTSLSAGFAYTWKDLSITFAIDEANILQRNRDSKRLPEIARFGTIGLSWRL